jgi:hypothetical protein
MTYSEEHAWDDLIPYEVERDRLAAIENPTNEDVQALLAVREEIRKMTGTYS